MVRGLDPGEQLRGEGRLQAEAALDRREETRLDGAVVGAKEGLERRDHVADHIFRRVVKQHREAALRTGVGRGQARDILDQKRVLGDREGVLSKRLPVPAGNAGKPVRDVVDLDVER